MKRLFDLLISFIVLFVLSPILVVLAMLVRLFLGSPVIFKQVRPGMNGVPFTMFKFRTMRETLDSTGQPLPDEYRLTRFGLWLRSTSLDELPELWNVIKGEMSLVGPRPLLMEYLELYSDEQHRRHNVRPGITGWAQINGRNNLSWEEKFKLDIWYVDNKSFRIDLKILFLTLKKVLARDGISPSGKSTVSKFTTNK